MTRKLALGILLCSAVAHAEGPSELTIAQFDPSQAVAPISVVEGPGIKIGEGTVLHPVFGMETGFVSNVFYNEVAKPAGILRLLGQIGTASLNAERLNPNAPISADTPFGHGSRPVGITKLMAPPSELAPNCSALAPFQTSTYL